MVLTFIVAPCIMESIYCSLTNKCTFYLTRKSLNLHENTHNYRPYMFRSSTILSELVQSLAKVTLMLKHSIKLRRCILCVPVVNLCPTRFDTQNSTLCHHSILTCFLSLSGHTAVILLYSIKWLVVITKVDCVYCAVRTKSLYVVYNSS